MQSSKVALAVLLLVSSVWTALHLERPTLDDFMVYQTAALLVREHRGQQIYDGADTGVDPQLRYAAPQSVFAHEAAKLGIPKVRMYVYPPFLADVLVPLSYLHFHPAAALWLGLDLIWLAAFCWFCIRLLNLPREAIPVGALLLGVATFSPAEQSIYWGQVTILLLFLWTLGIYSYARGFLILSALALAVATFIKLTPLLAIVPFLLWKEWRWVRAFLASLVAIGVTTLLINGPACFRDFIQHVMPAMSNGTVGTGSRSVITAVQRLYLSARGLPVTAYSHSVGTVGKALSLLLILISAALVARQGVVSKNTRVVVFSLFTLLSVLVSPVSWVHAYAVGLLTLVVLWVEALRQRVPGGYLALLILATLELNGFEISTVLRPFTHGVAFAVVNSLPVILGLSLILYRLAANVHFAQLEEARQYAPVTLATAV